MGKPERAIRVRLAAAKEDVRKYAAEHGITDSKAIESGMQAVTQRNSAGPGFPKRKEFVEQGSEVYAKT